MCNGPHSVGEGIASNYGLNVVVHIVSDILNE